MEPEARDVEFEVRGSAELRLARKFAANGSAAAAGYLASKGAEEAEGPESYETVLGAGWQFHLSNFYGFLSNEFSRVGALALEECLPDDPKLVALLVSKDEKTGDDVQRDRDLDFRGFVSLDEDFCSDPGAQMLAALLGSRSSIGRIQDAVTNFEFEAVQIYDVSVEGTDIYLSSKRELIEQAKVLERFPDEVYRLVLFAQEVNHYIESCRTVPGRRAARRRFREVILAASNLKHAAHARRNTRMIRYLDDPSTTSS
jgi:hypothetical protein